MSIGSQYILIESTTRDVFRFPRARDIPEGFKLKTTDIYNNSVFDDGGNLEPKYWAIKRYNTEKPEGVLCDKSKCKYYDYYLTMGVLEEITQAMKEKE